MAILKEEYNKFLEDIEKNIKNKEDLEYIKTRFSKFLDIIMEQMDQLMMYKEDKISKIEQEQKMLNEKFNKIEQIIENIEKDIYGEEGFDFEIICPYCNYEFVIDIDENKTEIECPECQNIIELDWSGNLDEINSECLGSCHSCGGCSEHEDYKEENKYNKENQDRQEENEDDM